MLKALFSTAFILLGVLQIVLAVQSVPTNLFVPDALLGIILIVLAIDIARE